MLNKHDLWKAAVATPVMLSGLFLPAVRLRHHHGDMAILQSLLWAPPLARYCLCAWHFFLIYGLTGAITGVALPRQAVRGVCLGLNLFRVPQVCIVWRTALSDGVTPVSTLRGRFCLGAHGDFHGVGGQSVAGTRYAALAGVTDRTDRLTGRIEGSG